MPKMWMVRGESGRLYDDFREQGVVAIGWPQFAEQVRGGMTRKELTALYKQAEPLIKNGTAISGASQVWRFVNEFESGDRVVTYSPGNRTYMVGTIAGDWEYRAETAAKGMALVRPVDWSPGDIDRDVLGTGSKNSLGSTLTLFQVPEFAAQDLLSALEGGKAAPKPSDEVAEQEADDPLSGMEDLAIERIKDLVSALDWEEMQELVAGLLRAMGYKTQVSPSGPDRGKDIIASPDGFGFENPRIVVEVKHRSGRMGSQELRSFLGGRHKDDRGLYVSTGGFSKDAYYEAERANVPVMLWTMDHLVRALIDHYEATDAETKRLVPLRRAYLPA
jgi:restriction system protein